MPASEVEDDVTSRRLRIEQDPDCDATMTTTKPTSEVEDEVKSEQDRDFQCNDHELCDEEDDEIYDGHDASNEEDDQLCSSFGLEHQRPGRRPTTAKRCTMRHCLADCVPQ